MFNYLGQKGTVKFEYSRNTDSHIEPKKNILGNTTYIIIVNPTASTVDVAGTIAHEVYHIMNPENTLRAEYTAMLIGDIVRNDIVQAGYGTSSDIHIQLNKYNVITGGSNQNLATDPNNWFRNVKLERYIDVWHTPPL